MDADAAAPRRAGPADSPGFWDEAWGWPQSVTIVVMLVGVAAVVQALHPELRLALPAAPWNVVIVFGPLLALAAARRTPLGRMRLLRLLGGVPMAVAALGAMALLVVPAAVWPQGAAAPGWVRRLGAADVFASLPMGAAQALLLANLAISTAPRLARRPGAREARYVLLHGGLLVAVGAALAGASAVERLRLPLREGEAPTRTAVAADGSRVELPFAVGLLDFVLESYPPTMAFATPEASTGEWVTRGGSVLAEEGAREAIGRHRVVVREVISRAAVVEGVPRPFDQPGAGPAVRVEVFDDEGRSYGTGWLHAAGAFGEELFLQLDATTVVLLDRPRPRRFTSRIVVEEEAGASREEVVGVNAPVVVRGWFLYQLAYDEEAGAASRLSILEVVRDGAWPWVAAGCWMAIAGALWFLWDAAGALGRRSAARGDAAEEVAS